MKGISALRPRARSASKVDPILDMAMGAAGKIRSTVKAFRE
jgi:hypothetical protein